MTVQKIFPRDPVQHLQFCEQMFNILQLDLAEIIVPQTKHISIWTVMLISKTADIGQRKTLEN